jgi:predicted Zn-dependent peptidase
MNGIRTLSRLRFAALAAACLAIGAAHRADAALDPRFDPGKLVYPSLNPIQKVEPQRSTLPNGMVLYLLEDHTLPVVRAEFYVKGGSLWEPAAKAGLGRLTGEVMRSGGSAAKTGDWLDDRLAAIGASISTYIGQDFSGGSFRCLSDNAPEIVSLVAEVLRRPAFPEDKIELSKVGMRREIASRNDELFSVLSRTATQALYGKDSPYARTPEYATVEAITREDCLGMHARCFAPNHTILVVYGDFSAAAMKKLIAASFGDWKRNDAPLAALPPIPGRGPKRVMFAPKEDVTQSGILLAHPGHRADSPDYADMQVMEQALGGGFSSRLFNRIRTQRGLAYTAGSTSGAGFFRPGNFIAYTLTRNDSVMVALDLLRAEVEKVTREPVTPEELKVARDAVENAFVFNFERPSSVAFRAGFYELAGYPADFLQKYQAALGKVTAESMLEAAKRQIEPDKLVTVIVGKEKEFDRPLESLGQPLERVDISIPPPPSKVRAGEASPEALAKGQALLKKAAELAGGSAAWSAVKSIGLEQKLSISMQGQSLAMEMSLSWVLPDRQLAVQKTPMGEMSQGFDGTSGWAKMMGQIQETPGAADEMKQEYERSLFHVLGHPSEIQAQALPEPQTVDGVTYAVAFVKSERVRDWMLYFSPDGKLARMEYTAEGRQGPTKQTAILDDWKPLGAIQYPHAMKLIMDGKPFMEMTVASAKLDAAFDEAIFKKPAN